MDTPVPGFNKEDVGGNSRTLIKESKEANKYIQQ